MLITLHICAVLQQIVNGKHIPKVIHADFENILNSPHVAALKVKCLGQGEIRYFGCGSSIVTERFLLSAAHCMYGCDPKSLMKVSVGDNNKKGPNRYVVHSYLIHRKYEPFEPTLGYDIALMKLVKSMHLGSTVQRVALMKNPPITRKAQIAGWGYVDENHTPSDLLKVATQYVLPYSACPYIVKHQLPGVLCTTVRENKGFPTFGDSGSALMVDNYIQIGIASFRKPFSSIAYYTATAYYYDWIKRSVSKVSCTDSDAVVMNGT